MPKNAGIIRLRNWIRVNIKSTKQASLQAYWDLSEQLHTLYRTAPPSWKVLAGQLGMSDAALRQAYHLRIRLTHRHVQQLQQDGVPWRLVQRLVGVEDDHERRRLLKDLPHLRDEAKLRGIDVLRYVSAHLAKKRNAAAPTTIPKSLDGLLNQLRRTADDVVRYFHSPWKAGCFKEPSEWGKAQNLSKAKALANALGQAARLMRRTRTELLKQIRSLQSSKAARLPGSRSTKRLAAGR